jgi:SAM-dependent methyltransferase
MFAFLRRVFDVFGRQKLADLEASVNTVKWYHSFEVCPGVWSKGQIHMDWRAMLDTYGVGNLTGKTVADVGAWDGAYSFALEERGARIYSIDIQDPDKTGYNVAHRLRNSKAKYIRSSVYDIASHGIKFDGILLSGVFYHLKYPILAFEKLNEALKPNGILWFSGESFLNYAETLGGKGATGPELMDLAKSDIPLCLIYPGKYKNASNWHVPNIACIKGWLGAAGFTLHRTWTQEDPAAHVQTVYGVAEKTGTVEQEHPLVGTNMWNEPAFLSAPQPRSSPVEEGSTGEVVG